MRKKLPPGRVSIRQAAAWAGIKETTAGTWAKHGLVQTDDDPGCGLETILQLCLFNELNRVLGFEHARRVWLEVRDGSVDWKEPAPYVKVVSGEVAPIVEIAHSSEELDVIVSTGDPVRVVTLHPLVAKVRRWYEIEVKAQWAAASSAKALPAKGRRRRSTSALS